MGFFSRLFSKRQQLPQPSAQAANKSATWPFDQSPETAAITTRQVIEEIEEIHVVVHYSDDHSWAFLCGTTDEKGDGRVTTMGEALAFDETLATIADLPPGWKAWRERVGSPWQRAENFERG
jgi:hypothetical protein